MRAYYGELDLETDQPKLECVAWSRAAAWWCGIPAAFEAVRHGCWLPCDWGQAG